MRSVSLEDVAAGTGGRLEGPERLAVRGVSTDTRTIRAGDLFVALRGERYDGHQFVEEALSAGAVAALVESRDARNGVPLARDLPLVTVPDTLRALGDLASYVRRGLALRAVGITGSTGKTCTKDLLVSVLSRKYRVAASQGSYNNEVGAPLTIFSIKNTDEVLVSEMGARHAGDITRLTDIVRPELGIITNVGVTHLQLFGSVDGVADAKAELARALPPDGALFLNAGDRWTTWISRQTRARVVRFGSGKGSRFRATDIELDAMGRATFTLRGPGFEVQASLPVPGSHQVENALAAAACASEMGVSPAEIAEGLAGAQVSGWRVELLEAPAGFLVLNDAYNANPHSLSAALETLQSLSSSRRAIAVLGAMTELGARSREFHAEAGRESVRRGVDILVTVGRRARDYASAACAAGLPRGSAFRVADERAALELLAAIVEPGDVILVKASRVQGLDRLALALASPDFHIDDEGAVPDV